MSVQTMRSEVRERVLQRIQEVAEGQAQSFGATATVEVLNSCPSLVNGAEMTEFATQVARDFAGEDKVHTDMPLVMGSEDFAFMLQANPNGCYLVIGNGTDCADLHNPRYDFNDEILPVAAAYWCELVERYLV